MAIIESEMISHEQLILSSQGLALTTRKAEQTGSARGEQNAMRKVRPPKRPNNNGLDSRYLMKFDTKIKNYTYNLFYPRTQNSFLSFSHTLDTHPQTTSILRLHQISDYSQTTPILTTPFEGLSQNPLSFNV